MLNIAHFARVANIKGALSQQNLGPMVQTLLLNNVMSLKTHIHSRQNLEL